jgi:Endonuclease-reverse transcriptase
MSVNMASVHSSFPFYNLTNSEFSQLFSSFAPSPLTHSLNLSDIFSSTPNDADTSPDTPNLSCYLNTSCSYSTEDEISSWPTFRAPFSILAVNSRSLIHNFNKIELLLQNFQHNPDIIAVSETWLKNHQPLDLFTMNNYSLISFPRTSNKRGGGVAMYINANINYNILKPPAFPQATPWEIFAVEVALQNAQNVIIVNLYRPPDTDMTSFTDFITEYINSLNIKKKHLLIVGDFNIDLLRYNLQTPITSFLDSMLSSGLSPVITLPTRITHASASLLDNIFTNKTPPNHFSKIIYNDISDHLPIFYSWDISNYSRPEPTLPVPSKRIFSAFNYSTFINYVHNIVWDPLIPKHSFFDTSSPNQSYNLFYNKIYNAFDTSFPLVKAKPTDSTSKQSLPWMTTPLILACRKKSRLLKNLQKIAHQKIE